MDARHSASPMTLVLTAGQAQRVLVEAGSMLVVMKGVAVVYFPFGWLAETVVAQEIPVRAEETHCLPEGGWIDLVAVGHVEAVILPPDSAGLWMRLGRNLARMLAATVTTKAVQDSVGADCLRSTDSLV